MRFSKIFLVTIGMTQLHVHESKESHRVTSAKWPSTWLWHVSSGGAASADTAPPFADAAWAVSALESPNAVCKRVSDRNAAFRASMTAIAKRVVSNARSAFFLAFAWVCFLDPWEYTLRSLFRVDPNRRAARRLPPKTAVLPGKKQKKRPAESN